MSPIEIAAYLEQDRSKASINALLKKLDGHPLDIGDLLSILPSIKLPVRWYMTWFLTHYVESNPEIGNHYQSEIWSVLEACEHQGMQRDLWRTMTFIEVNEERSGAVYDKAVKTCMSQINAVAVRAHAMLTAANIAKPFPELRQELQLIFKAFEQEESAGLRSRSRNLIRMLRR